MTHQLNFFAPCRAGAARSEPARSRVRAYLKRPSGGLYTSVPSQLDSTDCEDHAMYSCVESSSDRDEEQTLAAARFTLGDTNSGELANAFSWDELGQFDINSFAVLTHLSSHTLQLPHVLAHRWVQEMTSQLWLHGARFCFSLTPPNLVGLFSQLGFRRYTTNFACPQTGLSVPMVLVGEDIPYLQMTRSPCARAAANYNGSVEAAEWFAERNSLELGIAYERFLGAEYYWRQLCDSFRVDEFDVLAELSDDEAKALLTEGVVLSAARGDTIAVSSIPDQYTSLILSGEAAFEPPAQSDVGWRSHDRFAVGQLVTSPRCNHKLVAQKDLSFLALPHQYLSAKSKELLAILVASQSVSASEKICCGASGDSSEMRGFEKAITRNNSNTNRELAFNRI